MIYDLSFVWIWLALAAAVGGFVGWRNEAPGPQDAWFEGWFRYSLIALAVGFVISLIGLLGGRQAFWVETAVLFYAAYLVGCLAGGAARRSFA